jgi:hypothetical protein
MALVKTLLVAVVLALSVTTPALADTAEPARPVDKAPLKVTVDRSTVDLAKHRRR